MSAVLYLIVFGCLFSLSTSISPSLVSQHYFDGNGDVTSITSNSGFVAAITSTIPGFTTNVVLLSSNGLSLLDSFTIEESCNLANVYFATETELWFTCSGYTQTSVIMFFIGDNVLKPIASNNFTELSSIGLPSPSSFLLRDLYITATPRMNVNLLYKIVGSESGLKLQLVYNLTEKFNVIGFIESITIFPYESGISFINAQLVDSPFLKMTTYSINFNDDSISQFHEFSFPMVNSGSTGSMFWHENFMESDNWTFSPINMNTLELIGQKQLNLSIFIDGPFFLSNLEYSFIYGQVSACVTGCLSVYTVIQINLESLATSYFCLDIDIADSMTVDSKYFYYGSAIQFAITQFNVSMSV